MINVADRIGRDLKHVNAVFTVSGMGQNQLFYADSAFIKPLAPMIFMTRVRW